MMTMPHITNTDQQNLMCVYKAHKLLTTVTVSYIGYSIGCVPCTSVDRSSSLDAGLFQIFKSRASMVSTLYTGTLNGVASIQTGSGGEGSHQINSLKNEQGRGY